MDQKKMNDNSNSNSNKNSFSNYLPWQAWLFLIIIAIGAVGTYLFHFNSGFSKNPQDWSSFGSYLGGILTPCISLLALIAFINSIKLQKIEIQKTIAAMNSHNFDSVFFELLRLYNGLIEKQQRTLHLHKDRDELASYSQSKPTRLQDLRKEVITGREIFSYFCQAIDNDLPFDLPLDLDQNNLSGRLENIKNIYNDIHPFMKHTTEHVFSVLYRLIDYVYKTDHISTPEKSEYMDHIIGSLSHNERFLLLCDSLAREKTVRQKQAIIDLKLLDSLIVESDFYIIGKISNLYDYFLK